MACRQPLKFSGLRRSGASSNSEPATALTVLVLDAVPVGARVPVHRQLPMGFMIKTVVQATAIAGCHLRHARVEDRLRILKSGCHGRADGFVAEPRPSQTRACAIDAPVSSHGRFAQGAWIDRVTLALGRGNRAGTALNRSRLIRLMRWCRPSRRPLSDFPQRLVKPRQSNRFDDPCQPAIGRKSTCRVLVGWNVNPCSAGRASRATSTRSPSRRLSRAMTKSSARRTRRKAPTLRRARFRKPRLQPLVDHAADRNLLRCERTDRRGKRKDLGTGLSSVHPAAARSGRGQFRLTTHKKPRKE